MLDESLVFHKTSLGAEEIGGPSRSLGAKLRRALILVDGAKTVADLAPMFRPGEIDSILEELQVGGYITLGEGAVAFGSAPPPEAPAASPPGGLRRFDDVKLAAMREVMDRLGPDGDTLAVKIERASSPADLRAAIAEAGRVLESIRGAAAARAFAEKIGRVPG